MNLTELEKSILRVMCYFDIFGYPLTLLEIWKWLDTKIDISEVQSALKNSQELKSRIDSKFGFYFLSGREINIDKRLSRYLLADKKIKKAISFCRWLKFFPWIKAVAVYSSLSFSNSGQDGDIDLFVVTGSSRLWSSRFFINLFLTLFYLLPTAENKADKFCLIFLAAEDGLDFCAFLPGWQNLSLALYSNSQFMFIADYGQTADLFFSANSWLKNKLPNWQPYQVNQRRYVKKSFSFFSKFFQLIFGIISDDFYHRFQIQILPTRYRRLMGIDHRVVSGRNIIKLHDNDKSCKIEEELAEKLKILNV